MLDRNAVRFTSFEAWWLVDGPGAPISPGKVLFNAAVMRERSWTLSPRYLLPPHGGAPVGNRGSKEQVGGPLARWRGGIHKPRVGGWKSLPLRYQSFQRVGMFVGRAGRRSGGGLGVNLGNRAPKALAVHKTL